jgi:amidohydrolase
MIATRRDLHEHPELSGKEYRTAEIVAHRLAEIGVDGAVEGVADTGVVGWICGALPGPTVLLRADIDALPIAEADRGQPYLSQNPGVHHGCGHDGHTAALLAAAEVLVAHRDQLPGAVVLLFQPAEERGGGARRMLSARAWPEDLVPVASLGLHLTTALNVGTVDVRAGVVTASAQSVDVRFSSRGGHAASPHLTPDPVVCASEFIMSAQTVISRSLDPRSSAVVTFGCIHGGITRSAIPTTVEIEGTVRTYANEDLGVIRRRIPQIAEGVAAAHGCTATVDFKEDTYPAGINDPAVTALVAQAARTVVGDGQVSADMVIAGADDMAEILLDIPGCYFFVGGAHPERGLTADMHSPDFDFDEDALRVAAETLVAATRSILTHIPSSQAIGEQ